MNPFQSLVSSLAGVPVLRGARCRGRHDLFDPQLAGEIADVAEARHVQAQSICGRCPALAACGSWLDSLPKSRRPAGVVAGRIIPLRTVKQPRKSA